jgi:hypothetical protein
MFRIFCLEYENFVSSSVTSLKKKTERNEARGSFCLLLVAGGGRGEEEGGGGGVGGGRQAYCAPAWLALLMEILTM